jgi:hypothetical protein
VKVDSETVRDFVMRLLAIQLKHYNGMCDVEAVGVSLPATLEVDLLDVIADLYGVPEDNTAKQPSGGVCDENGTFLEGVYCRDWIMDTWDEVRCGSSAMEDFLETINLEGAKYR